MTEGRNDIGARLQESQDSLRDMQASLRKARAARLLGTLAGLVIAVIYACLFIGLVRQAFDLQALAQEAQRQVSEPVVRNQLTLAAREVVAEVGPVYVKELKNKVAEADLAPMLTDELTRLAEEVMPELADVTWAKLEELELTALLAHEFGQLAADIMPDILEQARARTVELGVAPALQEELSALVADVGPVFVEQAKARAVELDLMPVLEKELAGLVADSGAALMQAAQARASELDLTPALMAEFGKLSSDVLQVAMAEAKERAAETDLVDLFADEFLLLAQDVGPTYLSQTRQMMLELGLLNAFADEMQGVAAEVGPIYREHLHRVAPEILRAAEAEFDGLAQAIAVTMQRRVAQELRNSLEKNEEYIRETTGLTPEVVEDKLAYVVIAAEEALVKLVQKRTDAYQADLQEINALLAKVPNSQREDPDWLVDEIGKVSVQLLKINLPEHESELEWPGGAS